MRTTTRILSLSVATALALAAPSGAAVADPGDASGARISLSPPQARPGAIVEIRVDCSAFADPRPSGVSSPGFEQGTVELRAADQDGHYRAEATAVAQAGTYGVDGDCRGDQGTDGTSQFIAELTIAGEPVPSPSPTPTAAPEPSGSAGPADPSEPPRPSGKVDAGHGPGGSPGAGSLAGVAVALAGVGGGVWLLRRRHAESGG